MSLQFDPSYFLEEEREGFVIKPMIKRAWAAQLEVLQQIDIICKRHNIQYYAEYGTLLGAVRHQGFVPWDDDMDIGMLRKDYTRFQYYAARELPEPFKLLSMGNHNHKEFIARVINGYNIKTTPGHMEQFHGCPYVVGVDIFISDNIPLDPKEEAIQIELLGLVHSLGRQWEKTEMSEEEKEDCLTQIEEVCRVRFDREQNIMRQLIDLSDKIAAMYWDVEAKEVTFMAKLFFNRDYRLPISCFETTVEVPFDQISIPIPIGYHDILTRRYGTSYMTPVNYSIHGYPFYKDQEEMLIAHFQEKGIPLPDWLME